MSLINERIQTIRQSNRKYDCVRGGRNEGKSHFLAKAELAYNLMNAGHTIITEAIFNSGGRADVVDLTDGIIYEVLDSEETINLENKRSKYPDIFKIDHVRVLDD